MSGPITDQDASPQRDTCHPDPPEVEITESRSATVGSMTVRRALPRRARRTVGSWCFVDHMGPVAVTESEGVDVGPHPHIGLQTVTWLLAGEILHRDSLGSEQIIRPGQMNLMTAGAGVVHAEEHTRKYRGDLHGLQLWVAQPEGTRNGAAAFEHHGELPGVELGVADATVLVGEFHGAKSPARRDTDHVGVQLEFNSEGNVDVPMDPTFEYALVVMDGSVSVEGSTIVPGKLAYLGEGRDECRLSSSEPSRVLLIGGVPFEDPIIMWWNFVARTKAELSEAQRAWMSGDSRFGSVDSRLSRIPVGEPPF
ncbi:MAG TPA: pirin family protein [Microthrixaceae bacterium]|nr:pirin family protein [Microthrixaceae bacterium]